jgi:cytochrome c556
MRKILGQRFQQEDSGMGFTARIGAVAAVAAVAGLVLMSSGTIDAALMGDAAIKARKDAMKSFSANNKVIQAFVKDGKGTTADVADKATAIAATAKQIPELFPKGSGRGDFPDKVTRALPAIWTDMAGFDKNAKALVAESAKLAGIAKAGDKAAITKQVAEVGKVCGACHKAYRGDVVK